MPVKIRLTRMGKKKQPTYRVVVMDSRKPRDGAYIEQIGRYDPRQEPSVVEIDNDAALKWLQRGAQPTERAQKLLEISGAWARFRVARGEIHTIDDAPPPAPPPPKVVEEPVAEVEEEASATDAAAPEAGGAVEAEAEAEEEAVEAEAVEEEAAGDEEAKVEKEAAVEGAAADAEEAEASEETDE